MQALQALEPGGVVDAADRHHDPGEAAQRDLGRGAEEPGGVEPGEPGRMKGDGAGEKARDLGLERGAGSAEPCRRRGEARRRQAFAWSRAASRRRRTRA